jgi:hypothetical protein
MERRRDARAGVADDANGHRGGRADDAAGRLVALRELGRKSTRGAGCAVVDQPGRQHLAEHRRNDGRREHLGRASPILRQWARRQSRVLHAAGVKRSPAQSCERSHRKRREQRRLQVPNRSEDGAFFEGVRGKLSPHPASQSRFKIGSTARIDHASKSDTTQARGPGSCISSLKRCSSMP